jgi:hypothetical protein
MLVLVQEMSLSGPVLVLQASHKMLMQLRVTMEQSKYLRTFLSIRLLKPTFQTRVYLEEGFLE